jgi:hypothetical protein
MKPINVSLHKAIIDYRERTANFDHSINTFPNIFVEICMWYLIHDARIGDYPKSGYYSYNFA